MTQTVTVAIHVYNGEKFIKDALDSIVFQTVKVDKIIICDNLSTDRTIKIIKDFSDANQEFDVRIYTNPENIGFQNNFIECYRKSETDFLIMLQVDDILKSNAVENLLKCFNTNENLGVVGGQADIVDVNGKLLLENKTKYDKFFGRNEIFEFISHTSSYILFSTVMYNLNLLKGIPYLNESSIAPEELYWPLVLKECSIAVLGTSIIDNRRYSGQMHNYNAVHKMPEYLEHFRMKIDKYKLESSKDRQHKTKKIIEKQVAQISINLGKDAFIYFKEVSITAKYFFYAFKKHPNIFFTKYFVRTIFKMFSIIK